MSDHPTAEQADNRIVGSGVSRQFHYDGESGVATFYTGVDEISAQIPFVTAQAISLYFATRYREGYRDGIAACKHEIHLLGLSA